MSDLMQSIDERTRLAGSNRLEPLMFALEDKEDRATAELFGVNVFKVRELITVPKLVRIPDSPECMVGLASIRGTRDRSEEVLRHRVCVHPQNSGCHRSGKWSFRDLARRYTELLD